MSGWRTIVVERPMKLSIHDGQLIMTELSGGETDNVPLDEIARIVLAVSSGMMSLRLMQMLAEENISLVICDRQHNPCGEALPISLHEEAAGCIMDQACWTPDRKGRMWAEIVSQKLKNQVRALTLCGQEVPSQIGEYICSVEPGDPTNREALAAKIYFRSLFGDSFVRHARDSRNAALNYGYALIRSGISRALVMHGYHPAIGIHHCSRNNRVNLSCDLMEPFRPIIDRFVFSQGRRFFDKSYKRDLISLMRTNCIFAGKRMTIDDAAEAYSLQACKAMTDGRECLPEVCLE